MQGNLEHLFVKLFGVKNVFYKNGVFAANLKINFVFLYFPCRFKKGGKKKFSLAKFKVLMYNIFCIPTRKGVAEDERVKNRQKRCGTKS